MIFLASLLINGVFVKMMFYRDTFSEYRLDFVKLCRRCLIGLEIQQIAQANRRLGAQPIGVLLVVRIGVLGDRTL